MEPFLTKLLSCGLYSLVCHYSISMNMLACVFLLAKAMQQNITLSRCEIQGGKPYPDKRRKHTHTHTSKKSTRNGGKTRQIKDYSSRTILKVFQSPFLSVKVDMMYYSQLNKISLWKPHCYEHSSFHRECKIKTEIQWVKKCQYCSDNFSEENTLIL